MPEKVENVLPALAEANREEQARVDVELDEMARKREQAKVIHRLLLLRFTLHSAASTYNPLQALIS